MKSVPRVVTTSQLPFSPEPPSGRVFEGKRTVRSTDVTPGGRFRFDALARALQDVAEDDVAGTGWHAPYGWLLRRCAVTVLGYPELGARLRLRTFCSATGPRWAQRTTTVAGPDGPLIQAVAVWAAVDRASGQPVPATSSSATSCSARASASNRNRPPGVTSVLRTARFPSNTRPPGGPGLKGSREVITVWGTLFIL